MALPDGMGEADTEREARGDGDAEGQPLGEGLKGALRDSRGEAVEEAVGAAWEAVTSAVGDGGAGEGEGEALAGAEEAGLAVTPGLMVPGAVTAPDAEGACGVGVPEPLCSSLAMEEAEAWVLAKGWSDAPLLALATPDPLVDAEGVPRAAVGDALVDAEVDSEKKAALWEGGADAVAAGEGERSCRGDVVTQPLSVGVALVEDVALKAAVGAALTTAVGEGTAEAVGAGGLLLTAEAERVVVELVAADCDAVALREAGGDEEPLWQGVADADPEVVAVVEAQGDTAAEREGEFEGRAVPLGTTVPRGVTDNNEEALGGADGPPLKLPTEDAADEGLGRDDLERVGVVLGVAVPEKRGEGEGVGDPDEVADPRKEGLTDPVAAAADSVGATELAAHRVAVGEAHMDTVSASERVAKGVGEMEGVARRVFKGDALTRAVELGAAPD